MLKAILLAIALAMDAFAVAIGLGASYAQKPSSNLKQTLQISPGKSLAILAGMCALYFGLAQGIMPLIGYMAGSVMLGWLAASAPWIGCMILLGLGSKLLYDGLFKKDEPTLELDDVKIKQPHIKQSALFTLAIATSIDAMAAGFTLNLLDINALLACALIAIITAIFSGVGVFVGYKSGTWLEDKAAVFGGVVLIIIGINMVL